MFSATTTSRLAQAATLANTAPGPRGGRLLPERLDQPAELPAALPGWNFDEDPSSATLRSVRKLRAAVAGIWQDAHALDIDAALEGVNHLLASAGPVHVIAPEPATARTPAVLAAGQDTDVPEKTLSTSLALALAEVALAGELTRLRTCSGEDCTNAFVDLTRNRSKQFCDEANCANRAHVKAYRARRAAEFPDHGELSDDGDHADYEAESDEMSSEHGSLEDSPEKKDKPGKKKPKKGKKKK
ncbi:CGNR zinc finger domain-containing protein [Citricoccus parietis]|uniref:CGNR zinc finger domain-containing protein n=1 Tax=Citricoccus parietis TaxID=592307 RepID=A0ABV6F818_9MICC